MNNGCLDEAWCLIIRSSTEELHEYFIKSGQNAIGRAEDNDIKLQDLAASSHHAQIKYDQNTNTLEIKDLNSTNGAFINSKKIDKTYILQQDDQIRIDHSYISVINNKKKPSQNYSTHFMPTKITGESILESVDQYSVLLHEISQRFVNIPALDTALVEISALIKRMIGADICQILLEDDFENIHIFGVSVSIAQKIIQKRTALIFSRSHESATRSRGASTQPIRSMLLVPVFLDQKVVALIFARKSKQAPSPFNNNNLQLVLAVSNQVAMSLQRSHFESELLHTSSHDSLTDLPNRTIFLERLCSALARTKREKGFEFAVLFFDIDNFKDVNDSLGHGIGDKLLIAVAERLKHNVRYLGDNSIIARFGGDEFAILLNDIKGNLFALAIASRLKDILSKPFRVDEKQIFSTVSIGVAVSSIGYEKSDRGVLNPIDFFNAIDTAGLIYSTDHWVLHTACIQSVEWQNRFSAEPPLFISVNLSAKNIKHPNLLANIRHVLETTKLVPSSLHIEITEKVGTPDDESAITVLKQLRSLGVRISLDDFGTGYSALSYLADMPVDILKIDRSFIQTIGKNDDSLKVIEMIKALANHLGLIVIAEGVEKHE